MSLYQTVLNNEQVYFDTAVTLLFFLLVGRYLDESLRVRARAGTRPAGTRSGSPPCSTKTAGSAKSPRTLHSGDRILVAAGERVAADGLVCAGAGQVDQSLITGETAPAKVEPGTPVYAGTLNLGHAEIRRHGRRQPQPCSQRSAG
ncbi:MAG: hypothetical protein R3D30_10895 [Hyphomicrobiales bacterium]